MRAKQVSRCVGRSALPAILLASSFGVAIASQCSVTSTGRIPLNDLGAGLYSGEAGGLYPGGSNQRPLSHDLAVDRVGRVLLRDAQGSPDPQSGKIVLMSVGLSNTTMEFRAFQTLARDDQGKNAAVVLVDGAEGGQDARTIADPDAPYWNGVDQKLAASGVTPLQVQAVWLKQARRQPNEDFPEDAEILLGHLRTIVQIIQDRYPNTRAVYLSSRIYAGYASTSLNPEPFAYQSGFSVKWLIQEQLEGSSELNFDPFRGPVLAPWLAWGPYPWADGLLPRSDGLTWDCREFQDDGTHPARRGREKVAAMLLDFFRSDSTTAPWFLDCDLSDPDTFAAPPEVLGLNVVDDRLAGTVTVAWDSLDPVVGPGASYDVLSGMLSDLPDTGFEQVSFLVQGLDDAPFLDPQNDPPTGDGLWYLVRSINTCGIGTWGDGSLVPDARDTLDAAGLP